MATIDRDGANRRVPSRPSSRNTSSRNTSNRNTQNRSNVSRNRRKKKNNHTVQKVVLVIQAIASLAAIITLMISKMLPPGYLIAVIALLLIMLFLVYLLTMLMRPKRKKNGDRVYTKRNVGYVLSACVIIFCLLGTMMLSKLIGTLSGMSKNQVVLETTAIYVMADNPAESIEDAKNYTFGHLIGIDEENTNKVFEDLEKTYGSSPVKQGYESPEELAAALYSGEAGAIVLNVVYEDILDDIPEFAEFKTDTRILLEKTIEVEVVIEENVEAVENIESDAFVVYISGNDARTEGLTRGRSDVNILGIVNPTTKQILLVNTPRDYYVEVSIAPGKYDKLTHCGIHGVQCSMDTLSNLYGVKVNYFGQVNFNGFKRLVDAVGGVTVKVDKSFTSTPNSSPDGITYNFKAGKMELNGDKALVYARERKAFAEGDLARGRHQMAVIKALIKKMSSGSILTHYNKVLDSVGGMCATNVSSDEMAELVKMQLEDGAEWNIQTYAVTGGNAKKTTYTSPTSKRYVMTQDKEKVAKAKSLIKKVMDGEILTEDDVK